MRSVLIPALFALQSFHVLFLALHDWVPLGSLNDTRAVREENSAGKILLGSVISTVPFAYLLFLSAKHQHGTYPPALTIWLGVAYAFLLAGELQAWWIPYARGADPKLVERYHAMFGSTHAFLPERNGIRVNTLHAVLHACTVLMLLLLALAAVMGVARL